MSRLSMTCSPVEERRPWGASSTGAASPEDSTAVMCLGIRTGESDGWFYQTKFVRFPSDAWSNLDLWTITYLFSHSLLSHSVLHGHAERVVPSKTEGSVTGLFLLSPLWYDPSGENEDYPSCSLLCGLPRIMCMHRGLDHTEKQRAAIWICPFL